MKKIILAILLGVILLLVLGCQENSTIAAKPFAERIVVGPHGEQDSVIGGRIEIRF